MSNILQEQEPRSGLRIVRSGLARPWQQRKEYKVTLKEVIEAHRQTMRHGDHWAHLERRQQNIRKPISDELYDRLKHIAPQWAYALKQGHVPINGTLSICQPRTCIMGESFGWSDAYRIRFNGYCDICLYFDKAAMSMAHDDESLLTLFCDHFEEAHVV